MGLGSETQLQVSEKLNSLVGKGIYRKKIHKFQWNFNWLLTSLRTSLVLTIIRLS